MDLNELLGDRAPLTVSLPGGDVKLAYRPAAITFNALRSGAIKDDAEFLAEVLLEWDITAGGEAVAVDEESIKAAVPPWLCTKLMVAVIQDAQLMGESDASRADGGSREASSELLPPKPSE